MTNKTEAAIEEAAKLPTEWDLLNKIWHIINQQVEEEILLSSEVQYEIEKHIESHTQAHTEGLRERVKELETTLSINRYTIEDMRKSFYAGHSLCDDEWRDKRKLVGFDEFIDSLK